MTLTPTRPSTPLSQVSASTSPEPWRRVESDAAFRFVTFPDYPGCNTWDWEAGWVWRADSQDLAAVVFEQL